MENKVANDLYLTANNNLLHRPAMRPLLDDMDPFYKGFLWTDPTQTHFWFGPGGTKTPLHFDPISIFHTHVAGRKVRITRRRPRNPIPFPAPLSQRGSLQGAFCRQHYSHSTPKLATVWAATACTSLHCLCIVSARGEACFRTDRRFGARESPVSSEPSHSKLI